ncbi:hypothetical protein TcBrA4_0064900 [Trypanosoma cruzi]|nr:hypothetical protein TcBrA4_0064900 [Trypanosoma cruzi]
MPTASLYLLDDPLSALDAHVGERIVADVLLGQLACKTRILATHQLHVLSRADYVVVVGDGAVRFAGRREEFMGSPVYKGCCQDASSSNHQEKEVREDEGDDVLDGAPFWTMVHHLGRGPLAAPRGNDDVGRKGGGSVLWSTYVTYFRACGGVSVVVIVLIIFLLTEMISLSSNVWLSMWSTQRFGLSTHTYLNVYVALVLFGTVTVPLRFSVAYSAMRQGSRNLHRLILRSVSIGTMQYFDTTPLGRIVNRFSRDVDCIDNQLQMTFPPAGSVQHIFFSCCGHRLTAICHSGIASHGVFLLQVDGPLQRHQQRNSSRRQHREGADDITSWRGTCWLLYHQGHTDAWHP